MASWEKSPDLKLTSFKLLIFLKQLAQPSDLAPMLLTVTIRSVAAKAPWECLTKAYFEKTAFKIYLDSHVRLHIKGLRRLRGRNESIQNVAKEMHAARG